MKLSIEFRQPKSMFERDGGPRVEGEKIIVFQQQFPLNDRNLRTLATVLARPLGGGQKTIELTGLENEVKTVNFNFSRETFEVV